MELAITRQELVPLHDRLVVQPVEVASEVKKGGILIPGAQLEKPNIGVVVATGPGRVTDDGKLQKMSVKAGDTILYGKYSGTQVKIENNDYLVMHDADVIGILKEKV